MSAGCSKEKSACLPFLSPRGCPHSLAQDPFLSSGKAAMLHLSDPLSILTSPSSSKTGKVFSFQVLMRLDWTHMEILVSLPISRSINLITPAKPLLPHSHRFWGSAHERKQDKLLTHSRIKGYWQSMDQKLNLPCVSSSIFCHILCYITGFNAIQNTQEFEFVPFNS